MDERQLYELIGKYLAGTASPAEEDQLLDWYNSVDHREITIPFESEREKELLLLRMRANIRRQAGHNASIGSLGSDPAPGRPILGGRALRYASAAMVLLLAGAGYLAYRFQAHKAQTIIATAAPVKHDVAPGHNGAILTLSDGHQIALDSTASGDIALQGTTRLVKQNGQLTYEAGLAGGKAPGGKADVNLRSGFQTRSDDLQAQSGDLRSHPADLTVVYNTMTTPRGRQFKLVLPDGTRVWLNAASSITYPTAFTGAVREVSVSGEAYFEVVHIGKQPFRVKTGGIVIEDLGTHFNVNAYPDEPALKTTLLEGSVKVSKGPNARILSPGQQAQAGNDGGIRVIRDVDVEEAMAWKNGLFQYNSTHLEAIMRQIARWYDVQVIYEGKVKNEFFSGAMPMTENVSQVLNMLAMTNTIHFTIEDNKIYVRP